MRISVNWLKELVDFDLTIDQLADRLTMLGLEVEGIHRPGAEITQVKIGKILDIQPHPDADKLVVCKTDVGESEPLQIVCGAKNMKAGDRVPTAVIGATLPGGFAIGRRKMRGIESQGMMCSARELGLGEDHDGLLILDESFPIGADALALLGLDDVIIEIEITPNRGDWAGMIGIARDLGAYLNSPLKMPSAVVKETGPAAASLSAVTIEDPDLCPRYIGRVIQGAKTQKSPLWMIQRLIAAGQRPINVVVDITNYILLETGHPLHAFDINKLNEKRIIVRRAKQSETIVSIDGIERKLTPDDLVIADSQAPVAIAGVMGGQDSEVTSETSDIFLESAVFCPRSVRRTARSLAMQTEASQRFQRGADPAMAEFAIDRAAALLQALAGGEVAKGKLDVHPRPRVAPQVSLRFKRTNALLGYEIEGNEQKAILNRLGFTAQSANDEEVTVEVPSWRQDVAREADLIEEVGRVYGFEKLPTAMPRVRPSERVFAPLEKRVNHVKQLLAGHGFTEMIAMSFSSPEDVAKAGLQETHGKMIALQNPLSEAQATMRSSLIPGILSAVSLNVRRGRRGVRLFEIGPVYLPRDGEVLPVEPRMIGVALAGSRQPEYWRDEKTEVDFYDIKGVLQDLAEAAGVDVSVEPLQGPSPLDENQAGAIRLGKETIGVLGKVKDTVAAAYDIDVDLYLLELNLDALLSGTGGPVPFQAISVHPPSLRDMAVIVDDATPAGEVLETARSSGGDLLQGVRIFDIYTGEQVPAGKKSLALELTFQAKDRTLTDKETQKSWDAILKKLQKNHQAELR